MPSSKPTLDLEAWGNFLSQQRSNDYEYNILLYKFRAFFSEVKDYQLLHNSCSIGRANPTEKNQDQTLFGNITGDNNDVPISSSLPPIHVKNINHSVSNINNILNHQNGDKKPLIHQPQSIPSYVRNGSETSRVRELILKQSSFNNSLSPTSSQHNYESSPQKQHYNSSYNLNSVSNKSTNNVRLTKPQIKQRNQVSSGSRILISKSSERLDSINNNHLSSLLSSDSSNLPVNKFNAPIARDSRFIQNDTNIYDAVSPDDYQEEEKIGISNVAASIQNLNRLSFLHRGKMESSKSSLGLGSQGKQLTPNSGNKLNNSDATNSSNGNQNEKSNNSFGSSIVIDPSNNHSTSSLSLLTSTHNKDNQKDQSSLYSNYVNIDFFLKRGNSPVSIDGLDGTTTNDENSSVGDSEEGEDTTQMSHSLSSEQICDEAFKELSTSGKRNNNETNISSASITPASSGDFLDEQRSSSISYLTHPPAQHKETSHKFSSFFSNHREGDNLNISKSSTSPRDSNLKNPLSAIHENASTVNYEERGITRNLSDDGNALVEAQNTMRSFLSDLNLSPVDDVFEDKAQRRIVKESFAVEFCGRRKLRHLFLFNDVIVCAKYQASSKQKFTFDVRWYLNLSGVTVSDLNDASNQVKYDKEAIDNQILDIRTRLMLLRSQMQHIKRSKHKQPSKLIKKLKKKRTEFEAELVLLLPHLPLVIKHISGKKYTFFLSSNFDRNQWIESIKFLQSQLPPSKSSCTSPSSNELQAWIQTCRKNLNPSLGTFLLRSNSDDDLLYGDLYINLNVMKGITKPGNYYFCFEVDSYGHFSQKASSTISHITTSEHSLNEEYVFPLDGSHTLRILMYEDLGAASKPLVIGKAHIELSRSWFLDKPVEKSILFNSNCILTTRLSYTSSELMSNRVPHAKLCPTFGMDITQVCKREKTSVPLLIQLCVNEVERRGMREVGIYRMSGTSTDIQRLKKAFETNPYVAEILLRDIDINSVTGFLKTYLREMPEGLFSNKLYLKFVAAFDIPQSAYLERTKMMLELFHKIPTTNQHTIIYLVEHLVKVNKYENYNKMSLANLATVLGPNILRSPNDPPGTNSSDPFTAIVIGSMSQAGILYFFLNRKHANLPMTELDPSEMNQTLPST